MYLTRMTLDLSKRKTLMALASPALFHGAVEAAFIEKGGKLWRLDDLAGKKYLLLLSEEKPELTAAAEQFGTSDGWKTIDYDGFLSNIHIRDHRRFRLKANPVVTKSAGTGARGKVMAHVTAEQQMQWLLERAEKYGFSLGMESFTVVQSEWETFQKGTDGKKRVTFRTATFEGDLTVTNADCFRQTLQCGMGREKAYGCGLMTVTRNIE